MKKRTQEPESPKKSENSSETEVEIKNYKSPNVLLQPKSDESSWNIALIVITVLSFVTRYYKISEPDQVVFDEVHFGKFASYYLRRTFYFDVHPPLGRLIVALVSYLVGYDGHFDFENIGDSYIDNKVPYIRLRSGIALFGSLIPPVVFLIMKNMKFSLPTAILVGAMTVFDNGLVTQARLILLDNMLILFCFCTVLFWVKFWNERKNPFTPKWWINLALTGVFLGCTVGVKLVGLLIIALVGIATLVDLWGLLDINRKPHALSMSRFWQHFYARALCLIVIPVTLYLSFFVIHFNILKYSGPGDGFMSPRFQRSLQGSEIVKLSVAVPYYANITIKHKDTDVYLHSHPHRYPLRYKDQRVSSQGQQVTGYPYADVNNIWSIEPVDSTLNSNSRVVIEKPHRKYADKMVAYVQVGDLVRLRHIKTNSYLITHDVASPLMSTNMEMTTQDKSLDPNRYDETLWRVEILAGGDKTGVIRSRGQHLRFVNFVHNVAIYSHISKLPDWAFKQQEVNGEKKIMDRLNVWTIETVQHETIKDEAETAAEEAEELKKILPKVKKMNFFSKYLELQSVMLSQNNALTKPHPYQSRPQSWPVLTRGISFWENKDTEQQIYLLGNPFSYFISLIAYITYCSIWIVDRLLEHRGIHQLYGKIRLWWDRTAGFLFIGYLLHYLPFFIMGRSLFLHHYLPASIFGFMIVGALFEFLCIYVFVPQEVEKKSITSKEKKVIYRAQIPKFYWVIVAVVSIIVLGIFVYFSPLIYGLKFKSHEQLVARKWLKTWDLQFTSVN
ncbi:glycosyltransferase family 39 protein [Piromyces sp. E2]|nr:glycosyltransferase family 39 protein [Piromyces sp. E2]|eukprot:OUM70253.1 glycosyltransferase family 39 protein [Piromyces sp. E2]